MHYTITRMRMKRAHLGLLEGRSSPSGALKLLHFVAMMPSLRQLAVATLFVISLNLFLVVQQLPPPVRHWPPRAEATLRQFFGLAPWPRRVSCILPDFEPFNKDFARIYGADVAFWRKNGYSCESPLGKGPGVDLRFNWASSTLHVVPPDPTIGRCVVRCVVRESDNEISFAPEQLLVNWTAQVGCEFFRLACYRNSRSLRPSFSNLYSRNALPKDSHSKLVSETDSEKVDSGKPPFNVLMFGMDGVSRQNFLRLMSKTRSFFEATRRLIDFKVYNKVRDNTFVNIVPMTTGRFVDELHWNESMAMKQSFDNFPFIWKDFARTKGYRTIYAEDFAEISIFNYLKMGFHRPPTEFYFRPMNLAMDADRDSWHGEASLCFKNRFEVDYIFDYVHSALLQAKLAAHAYFAFVYLTRITHEDQSMAVIADELYSQFFERLSRDGLLNDRPTVVILFSDHGSRWGSYRTTLHGKYEERLPAFFVALPKTFETDFPAELSNALDNSHKLVTPFDVYHTLKDILFAATHGKFGWSKPNQLGTSLFGKIPQPRSCQQAGVEQHWCACHDSTLLSPKSPSNTDLALAVVKHLNAKILGPFSHLCSNWTVLSIMEVRLLKPNDKFLLFKTSINDVSDRTVKFDREAILQRSRTRLAFYLVTVAARPPLGTWREDEENAVFEATVHARMDMRGWRSHVHVEGISRLNAYGSQSECVDYHSVKPFCYCHARL